MASEIVTIQKDITDIVNSKISMLRNEGLVIAPNYAPANALKSAFFKILKTKDRNKRAALEVCTKDSIANSLLEMVTQGLSPAKNQCYFIVYGNELQLQRSYFGTMAVLLQQKKIKSIKAEVIYEGDEFELEIVDGEKKFKKHSTHWKNQDNPIEGAYCIIEDIDGNTKLTLMTKKEIDKAWSKTKTGGGTQKEFPQEMAKKTVINRAAKFFINISDDSDILADSINKTTADEYIDDRQVKDVTETQSPAQTLLDNMKHDEQMSNVETIQSEQLMHDPETGEIIDAEVVEADLKESDMEEPF
ncbi:TPA: recombinase RecT [Streptococcus equi subsp. equi]|uniref:recombinase RecT n=1 Tax=Streptococcus equi TaxID=1336 RepID=UPI0006594B7C|nr:RecT family recombinase [Streptococcus equi]CRQ90888.1 Recombinational DNA repair protein RecT (prophage associated) [Streptococcus equi subsp. equi]HEK9270100.1 recombinase RecT [Streptococcus equi subsp. equi]HEK9342113.1 recombinase RecT [Streptococcus equi subsp. equi]HEK9360581.1 recombinase RecT [Streptococcus equi subsp. equi]HEK9374747.1 recombinase RecT [Streptococcus equi subsp. equi]